MNEIVTSVVIIYVYYTLSIGDEPELLYRLEYTKKKFQISSMVRLEEVLVYMIKRDLTKMTLNIFQPYLIKKLAQGFNDNVKSLTTFNASTTSHKKILDKK